MFLMRCLFTMFAEDVGLLPEKALQGLLREVRAEPASSPPMVAALGGDGRRRLRACNRGKRAAIQRRALPRHAALPLGREEIGELLQAAKLRLARCRAGDLRHAAGTGARPERAPKLGAHYTPRAYVERLVMPTIIEPLREDGRKCRPAETQRAKETREGRGRGEGASMKAVRHARTRSGLRHR